MINNLNSERDFQDSDVGGIYINDKHKILYTTIRQELFFKIKYFVTYKNCNYSAIERNEET